MKSCDAGNDLCDLSVVERWCAALPVPGEQQFEHDLWVHTRQRDLLGSPAGLA
jgi:hypothetical protein